MSHSPLAIPVHRPNVCLSLRRDEIIAMHAALREARRRSDASKSGADARAASNASVMSATSSSKPLISPAPYPTIGKRVSDTRIGSPLTRQRAGNENALDRQHHPSTPRYANDPCVGSLNQVPNSAAEAKTKITQKGPTRPTRLHVHAREDNPLYPPRLEVPDEKVSWSMPWDYGPVVFCSELVTANARDSSSAHRWADPEEPQLIAKELRERITVIGNMVRTLEEAVAFDSAGRPRNPCGRTGLRGQGLLGRWGPNHTADILVTTKDALTGRPLMLTVQCAHGGDWTIPSGMIFDTNSDASLLVRLCTLPRRHGEVPELHPPLFAKGASQPEEALKRAEFENLHKKLIASGRVIKRGYLDDALNTDNAWMEVTVYHFQCPPKLANMLQLCSSPGYRAAWHEPAAVLLSSSQLRYLKRLETTLGPLFLS